MPECDESKDPLFLEPSERSKERLEGCDVNVEIIIILINYFIVAIMVSMHRLRPKDRKERKEPRRYKRNQIPSSKRDHATSDWATTYSLNVTSPGS